jgi:hypothetical protein
MYPVCTRPLMCMLLGFESIHLPPNVALFALEDNQSSAKALEPRDCRTIAANVLRRFSYKIERYNSTPIT